MRPLCSVHPVLVRSQRARHSSSDGVKVWEVKVSKKDFIFSMDDLFDLLPPAAGEDGDGEAEQPDTPPDDDDPYPKQVHPHFIPRIHYTLLTYIIKL